MQVMIRTFSMSLCICYLLMTTHEAAWYIILVMSVCLFVCLMITFKNLDVGSSYLHIRGISTQPGHPFVGRRNGYQPKGRDALWLGSKGRYGSCVGGR